MNILFKISKMVQQSFSIENEKIGIDSYSCEIKDNNNRLIKVIIKREYGSSCHLPSVCDFRKCPACGIQHRVPYRRIKSYCEYCNGVKYNLMIRGITQKSMVGNMDKYYELVGAKSLLMRLNKRIKEHEKQD